MSYDSTRGLELGIPEKLLMERTGHRSVASLHKYQRPSEEENTMVRREMKALLKIHEPSNGYVWGGKKM